MTVPSGILQPTSPPDDPTSEEQASEEQGEPRASEEQGEPRDEGQESKATAKATRKNKAAAKASPGKAEGRKLYLPDDIHFRLRMLAYKRGQKLSECAADVLDKALPKWSVDRIG